MILDRSYQTEAVGSIWTFFRTNAGNPIVAMPTGVGKSIVIARFLQSVFDMAEWRLEEIAKKRALLDADKLDEVML